MAVLKNVKLGGKLMLLVIFPALGLLYFTINGAVEKYRLVTEMGSLQSLSTLAVRSSALVHETQKERGATALFLGSNGEKFGEELSAQRSETDKKIAELGVFLAAFDGLRYGADFGKSLDDAVGDLNRIKETREAVDAMTISADEAIGYYTAMNAEFLDAVSYVARLSTNAQIAVQSSAYVNFLQGKERAGIERAVLSNTFAADRFSEGAFRKFGSLVTAQATYTDVFLALATDEHREFFNSKVVGKAVTLMPSSA